MKELIQRIGQMTIIAFMLLLIIGSCENPTSEATQKPIATIDPLPPSTPLSEEKKSMPTIEKTAVLSYQITTQPSGSYGYDILSDGKLLIRQIHIPALPGIQAFKTSGQAERTAVAVIEKIKNGEMPPSLTAAEMQALLNPNDASSE